MSVEKAKDPGIPANFPYKDQILAEIAEQRRQAAEAKEKRKEEKQAAKLAAAEVGDDALVAGPSTTPSTNAIRTKKQIDIFSNVRPKSCTSRCI